MQANQAIDQLEQLKTDEFQTDDSVTDECDLPYAQLRKAMFDYNERLYVSGQSGLIDQLSYEKPDFLLSDYGIDSDILAYITIPSIDVKLPIYNGASMENMAKGAAYLANTSLPVGGDNTNCVIAAHTRYKGIQMFKRITELKSGDEIYITNFWETLVYKVVEAKIIDPNDSKLYLHCRLSFRPFDLSPLRPLTNALFSPIMGNIHRAMRIGWCTSAGKDTDCGPEE